MSYRLNTKRIALIVLLGNILALAVFGVLVSVIKSTYNDVLVEEAHRREVASAAASLISLRQTVRDTESLRNDLDTFFVKEDDAVSFIERLESLARRSGVAFEIVAADPNLTVRDKPSLDLTMTVEGSREKITQFSSLLEQLPLRVLSTAFDLRSTGRAEAPWQATIRMSVKSFTPRAR